MFKTYSLHKINQEEVIPFLPENYSEFKYGNANIARLFGTELAKEFVAKNGEFLKTKEIVVLSSPYSFIPTATYSMTKYFVYYLNNWLKSNNLKQAQNAKIDRNITYKDDYGALNAEQRLKLIGNDSFHVDRPFLKDKFLLFLDDIKITGSHQIVIENMIESYDLKNDLFFVYYAELTNSDIHPKIENFLNNFKIKSLQDLDHMIKATTFIFNTRVVKFILRQEKEAFLPFINNQSEEFSFELFNQAIGNGYHEMDEYSTNINSLEKLLATEKVNIT